MSNFAFYSIVFEIILSAPEMIRVGILEFFLQRSSTRDLRLLKGESKTVAERFGEFFAYSRPVTAPMDRPQIAMEVTWGLWLIY